MKEKPEYRVSVRNLVEFILRSGDIDLRRGSTDKEAMQKGGRLHRRIQKQMGSGYRAEVPLKYKKEFKDLSILVEGRADGVFFEEELLFVDEIKGLKSGIAHLEEPVPVHLAQAKCYAFFLLEEQGGDRAGVQMTYSDLEKPDIRRFRQVFSKGELAVWFEKLLEEYHKWLSFRLSWVRKRNASIGKLSFPFPYREGQKRMVGSVYHAISEGRQIFIQAPTGIGKTMATVYPAVRSLGEGKAEAVFYLTARTTTRSVAEESWRILGEQGLRFKTVTITAKEKACLCEEVNCSPDFCPYARAYEDRVNDAVFAFLQREILYDREAILSYARETALCPYEFTLDLALWVDGIICDYNYVFDPDVYLRRFFGEGRNSSYLFLIDECHNLVDRSREMYSARICRKTILELRRKSRGRAPSLYRALNRVNRNLLQLEKETGDAEVLASPGMLPVLLLSVQGEIEKIFEEDSMRDFIDEILEEYFEIRTFMNTSALVDENYVVYAEKDREGKVSERLFCVNPAKNLSERLERSAGTVFFSATLLPMRYYGTLLSARNDDYAIYVPSPFPAGNRCILCCPDVSSRYTRRGYEEYRRFAEYIARFVNSRQGNYMIFFPSYAFLDAVFQVYEEEFTVPWVRLVRQTPEMGERDREEFLQQFREKGGSLAAFCIMGGIFSEGIDLKGDLLIGAVIVGPGLPQVSREREILKDFYDQRRENGFDYAYRFPGMNKVLQAAGRVIRTAEDIGAILLLDDRFRQEEYASLMPPEWADRKVCRLPELEGKLREFWENR